MKTMSLSQRAAELAGIDTVLRAAGAHNWTLEAVEAHKSAELAKAPRASRLWKYRELINKLYHSTWDHEWVPDGIWFFFAVNIGNLIWFRGPAEWKVYDFDQHYRSTPSLARQIVAAARILRPDATIKIHELVQDKYVLDPILEIDGHYVLVWDADGNTVPPPV